MDMKLSLRVEVDPSRNFVRPQWFIVAELRSARSGSEIDEVHVPIAARKRFDVDFQSALLVRPEFALVRGSFSEAFGDLEAIAIGLDTLEIEPLVAYARSRYRQDEERIQILGVAIPQGVIGQWGLALLLGCQGYLVLHLRKFLGMSFTEDILQRFAWIVLYRDKVSSTVSLTTVAVFPALAACILVGNVWNATPSVAVRAVLSVELVFAFALAIASGLLVARINRRGSSAAAKS